MLPPQEKPGPGELAASLLGSLPCPSPNGPEEKHLPPLLQPPICLIQHSFEQDAKRAGQEVEEGGRRDGKEGRDAVEAGRGRGVKATWGYKYENTEKEGLLYKSKAGPNGRTSPSVGEAAG